MMTVQIRRIYESPGHNDGYRVLVDGLWPRGVRKADAAIDQWIRKLAPSKELRQWFGHDPERWTEFQQRYREELQVTSKAVEELVDLAGRGNLTLVYAARDTEHNNARVLAEIVRERL